MVFFTASNFQHWECFDPMSKAVWNEQWTCIEHDLNDKQSASGLIARCIGAEIPTQVHTHAHSSNQSHRHTPFKRWLVLWQHFLSQSYFNRFQLYKFVFDFWIFLLTFLDQNYFLLIFFRFQLIFCACQLNWKMSIKFFDLPNFLNLMRSNKNGMIHVCGEQRALCTVNGFV